MSQILATVTWLRRSWEGNSPSVSWTHQKNRLDSSDQYPLHRMYSLYLYIKLINFLLIHIEYSAWHLNFERKKKKDLQRILITWMCTQWHCSILSEFILSLIYELMLSFLFNFDHLANNLRIHNALCILNALLRAWLSILKKIRWCFLWFDDLNILEINKKSEWDKTCVLVILNVLLFTNNSV